VTIKPEDESAYLNPATPLDDVIPMLEAYPEDSMEVIKVSPRLTKATNNSPSFIQRYEGDAEEQSESIQDSTGQLSFFD
jgi:putative SOS response-associated peptidase YedK